ncbi:MAG: alpha/beta hydrolase, partial [Bacteroidota bacterium]
MVISAQTGADLHLEAKTFTASEGQEVLAESGYLIVKENRADPSSADIELRFVRLKSTAENPGAPLVYLEGGPGASSTWMVNRDWALDRWLPLLTHGDVILLDQRGTGASADRLTYINMANPDADILTSQQAAMDFTRAMVAPAKAAWEAAGVDYQGYTTMASAKDLDDLRMAMDLEQISIMGFSYGTHLGQAYLKYYGAFVDKAILIGVEGLDDTYKLPHVMDAQFRKISAMAAADPELGVAMPDLVASYQKVAAKLEQTPVPVAVTSPLTGEEFTLKIGKFGLDLMMFYDLGDATDIPVIPYLIHSIDAG